MIAALAGANPQFGQSQEDKMGNLGHSNPELYSSATHFDVLGQCGYIDPRRKRARIRSHARAGDRQTVKSTADVCVCVCVCVCGESRPSRGSIGMRTQRPSLTGITSYRDRSVSDSRLTGIIKLTENTHSVDYSPSCLSERCFSFCLLWKTK